MPELELATGQVREALQTILHTVLFIRSPGSVTPRDVRCEGFDLTYTRIATAEGTGSQGRIGVGGIIMESDLDRRVDDSIEAFLRSLSQIGPELLSARSTAAVLWPIRLRGDKRLLFVSFVRSFFFPQFPYENDVFIKTGSGQT